MLYNIVFIYWVNYIIYPVNKKNIGANFTFRFKTVCGVSCLNEVPVLSTDVAVSILLPDLSV